MIFLTEQFYLPFVVIFVQLKLKYNYEKNDNHHGLVDGHRTCF